MKLTQREKNIACVLGLVVVIYGFYWANTRGASGQERALLKSIKERRDTLDNNLAVLNESQKIQEQYGFYREQFGAKGSQEQEITTLIADVEAIALKHKVQITNLQPQKMIDKPGYKEIGVQIVVSGNFPSIIAAVTELQNTPYWMDLKEIRLEKAYGTNDVVGGRLLLVRAVVLENLK